MIILNKKQPTQKLRLVSFSNPEVYYEISVADKTCTCEAFKKGHCKHLDAVGIYKTKPWTGSTTPSFSQAMSGMVKSIRLRRVEDAMYWLLYLNKMPMNGGRFRLARRILIAAAEDGVSVPVMSKVASNYITMLKLDTPVIQLAAEIARICRFPNWWHSDSGGGGKYLLESLVAYRKNGLYNKLKCLNAEKMFTLLKESVMGGDMKTAMLAFDGLYSSENVTKVELCYFLIKLAGIIKNDQALEVLKVHADHEKSLSSDTNFLGQALWWMVGGGFNSQDSVGIPRSELEDMLEVAALKLKNPHPIPGWCCDGIHCSGVDRRFAGIMVDMVACAEAFRHYGRLSPDDVWLRKFYTLEGMEIL